MWTREYPFQLYRYANIEKSANIAGADINIGTSLLVLVCFYTDNLL